MDGKILTDAQIAEMARQVDEPYESDFLPTVCRNVRALIDSHKALKDLITDIAEFVGQLPSGIDTEADTENTQPDDMVAHIGGLIWQLCRAAGTEAT